MTSERVPEPDGAQRERTRLSWRRTTLSYTVVTALAVRTVLVDGSAPWDWVVTALTALAWLAFLLVAHRRIAALARGEDGRSAPIDVTVRGFVVAAVLCALAMTGFGAVLLW